MDIVFFLLLVVLYKQDFCHNLKYFKLVCFSLGFLAGLSFKQRPFLSCMCIYVWCRHLNFKFKGVCTCKIGAYKTSQLVVSCRKCVLQWFCWLMLWSQRAISVSKRWTPASSGLSLMLSARIWINLDFLLFLWIPVLLTSKVVATLVVDTSWFQGLQCDWSQKIYKHPDFGAFGRRWLMLPRVAPSSSFLQPFSEPLSLVTGSGFMSSSGLGLGLLILL